MAKRFQAEDFVAGIPSSAVLGILAVVGTGIAVSLGFMPTVINAAATDIAVGGAVFISELVVVAFENKASRAN